jgi:hypothetical protein
MSAAPAQISEDTTKAIEDGRRLGFDPESIANLVKALSGPAPTAGQCEGVWPEHALIVQAFLAVSLQWRVASLGGGWAPMVPMWIGLDYAAVRVGLDAEGIAVTPELWRGLRVMEAEACEALNGSN